MLRALQFLEGVVVAVGVAVAVGVVGEDWDEDGLEMVVGENRVQDKVHSGCKTVGLVVAGVFAGVHGSPVEDNLAECLD
jgi:hypothetical protein